MQSIPPDCPNEHDTAPTWRSGQSAKSPQDSRFRSATANRDQRSDEDVCPGQRHFSATTVHVRRLPKPRLVVRALLRHLSDVGHLSELRSHRSEGPGYQTGAFAVPVKKASGSLVDAIQLGAIKEERCPRTTRRRWDPYLRHRSTVTTLRPRMTVSRPPPTRSGSEIASDIRSY